ncbi:lysylphosphatidylglycerol synthase domain-containing protein [Ferrovibrio sp.]|uniref:lysylphosphatidylglycerol synthase domain-containing protein n=1 Tax=Ferrovibrio sp. TaxID=1917215 RepID=UPI0035B4BE4C
MLSRRTIYLALFALISGASLVGAVLLVGVDILIDAIGSTSVAAALLAGILIFLNTAFAFLRFRLVIGNFGYHPSWREALLAFTVGQVSNHVLLNIVGQSVSRAAALKSANIPFGASVVATYWERLIAAGLLLILCLIGAAILFFHIGIDMKAGGAYLISLIISLSIVSAVIFTFYLQHSAFRRELLALPRKIWRLWPTITLTLAAHFSMMAAYVVLLTSANLHPLSLDLMAAVAIVMFSASLPISFSGWGIRELSAAKALGAVGVTSSIAVASAVIIGLLGLLMTVGCGIVALYLYSHSRLREKNPSTLKAENISGIDHDRWLGLAASGATILSAILLFFQIRIPTEGSELTVNAADILALTGLGLLLLLAWTRRSFSPLPPWLVWSMLAISLLLLLSLGVGYLNFGSNSWALMNRGFGWIVILGYVALGAMLALIPQPNMPAHALRIFALTGVTIATLQVVLTFYSVFAGVLPEDAFTVPLRGYAGNSNAFAFQLMMTAACVIAITWANSSDRHLPLRNIALTLICAATYYSHSRAGFGMLIILLLVMVIFSQPEKRRQTIGSAVWVMMAYLLLTLAPHIIAAIRLAIPEIAIPGNLGASFLAQSLVRNSSDSERWMTIIQGWDMWLDAPLIGKGLGAYVQSRTDADQIFLVIHSIPIWLMAETGLAGLLLVTIVLLLMIKAAFQYLASPATSAWGMGLLLILAGTTAAGLVHDFFFQRSFWFLLGLFVAAAIHTGKRA